MPARKDLYNLKFNPKKERTAEFWDKFEEKVKVYKCARSRKND